MSENMTINMEKDQDNGQITYANEVISTIVSVATTEVDGISGIVGANPISGIIIKGKTPRGVRVDMDGEDVNVDISVTVDYGIPIQKVGRDAQENVRKSIESMTGLHVEKVDLHVVGVSFEKENQEMQLSQRAAMTTAEEEEEHAAAETEEEDDHLVVSELFQTQADENAEDEAEPEDEEEDTDEQE